MSTENYWMRVQQQRIRRRKLLGAAGVGIAGLAGGVVVGCGGDDDDDGITPTATPEATLTTTPGTTPAATPTEGPKAGGTLRFPLWSEPPNLDPHRLRSLPLLDFTLLIYSGLLNIEGRLDDEGVPVTEAAPDIATEWEQPDDTSYLFRIRPGVTFHDGSALTAEDVKASLERIGTDDPAFDRRVLMQVIDTVDLPEDDLVRIQLHERNGGFFNQLMAPFTRILSQAWLGAGHDPQTETMGSGPFVLDGYERGVRATFSKNAGYYIQDWPYLDGVEYLPQRDSSARVSAFRSDQADLIGSMTLFPAQVESVASSKPDAVIQRYLDGNLGLLGLNWARPPFDDERVRRAIAYALDFEEILATIGVWAGDGVLQGFIPPTFSGWAVPQSEFDWSRRDVAAAKALLESADLGEGFETQIVVTSVYPWAMDSSQTIAAHLKDIGIDVSIDVQEYADFHAARTSMDFDMMWISLGANIDPEEYITAWYRPAASSPLPQLEDLLDAQRVAVDEGARMQAFHELQRHLGDTVPVIPLVWGASYNAWQPYVRGFHPLPILSRMMPVKYTWFDKD